ncbi:MAG: lycopene cyclase domain-containing protein [Bacteroidales bacterium]|nr:lycopene cyclase domain-containing protein [Bacteroidales bacterium]
MEYSNFTYLFLLLIAIAYPLAKSFESRIRFYTKLKYIIPAIIITAIPFLIWDIIFENHHIWSFSSDHTIGVNMLGLPLEEWLFFLIIPYACFFIYETVIYFAGRVTFRFIRQTTLFLAFFLFLAGLLTVHLSYTFVSFILASVILFIIANKKHIAVHLSNFFKGYLVSLIPFFIINGVLTKLPVVLYNNEENLSLRIYSIPVEDAVYLLSLLFINFSLYEIFKQYDRKRQAQAQNGNR